MGGTISKCQLVINIVKCMQFAAGTGLEATRVSDMEAVAAMFPTKEDALDSSLRDGETSF